jgi:hypothetical protein
MRFLQTILAVGFTALLMSSCAQQPASPLDGTWRLNTMTVVEGEEKTTIERPGMGVLIFHGNWYSQVWMESERLYSDPPSDMEKVHAYDAFDASAGTFTYEYDRLKVTAQIARDPRVVEKSSTTIISIEGDTMTRTKERTGRNDRMIQWTSTYTQIR